MSGSISERIEDGCRLLVRYRVPMADPNGAPASGPAHLPESLAAHLPAGVRPTMLDYYDGPFQQFEEAVTADTDWDIAPGLAMMPRGVEHAIELCAGAGRLTASLATVARTVTAIERSPIAAASLRARFAADPAIRIVEGDLAEYREAPDADMVALLGLSIHVLPWRTVERAFALAADHLRPGGSFCVNVLMDGAMDRFTAVDDLVRCRRYRDGGGVERHMLTTTRFHPGTRMLEQYWMVRDGDDAVAARMTSHFWSPGEIGGAMTTAGLRIVERRPTRMEGGPGQGAGVLFLRAEQSSRRPMMRTPLPGSAGGLPDNH